MKRAVVCIPSLCNLLSQVSKFVLNSVIFYSNALLLFVLPICPARRYIIWKLPKKDTDRTTNLPAIYAAANRRGHRPSTIGSEVGKHI